MLTTSPSLRVGLVAKLPELEDGYGYRDTDRSTDGKFPIRYRQGDLVCTALREYVVDIGTGIGLPVPEIPLVGEGVPIRVCRGERLEAHLLVHQEGVLLHRPLDDRDRWTVHIVYLDLPFVLDDHVPVRDRHLDHVRRPRVIVTVLIHVGRYELEGPVTGPGGLGDIVDEPCEVQLVHVRVLGRE